MARETKVEEYERELARARRKLKQLKMEVRRAQGKVEEAGERTIPLEESISQSYEEILQVDVSLVEDPSLPNISHSGYELIVLPKIPAMEGLD